MEGREHFKALLTRGNHKALRVLRALAHVTALWFAYNNSIVSQFGFSAILCSQHAYAVV